MHAISPSDSCTEASNLYLSEHMTFCQTFIIHSTSHFKLRNLQKPIFSPCEIPLTLPFELNRESPLHVSLTASSLWICFAALHSHQYVTVSSKTWLWTYQISNTNFAETVGTVLQSLPLHYPVHQKTKRPQNLTDTMALNLIWRGRRKRARVGA